MSDTPQERAAAKIEWEMGTWKSIDFHMIKKVQLFGELAHFAKRPMFCDNHDFRCFETALGQRKCESKSLLGDSLLRREEAFFDGKRGANIVYGGPDFGTMAQVEVFPHYPRFGQTEYSNRPEPLVHYYVGFEPLYRALPHSEYLGVESVLGRPCDLFLFPQVKLGATQDLVYFLDHETGVPLRVRAYKTRDDLKAARPVYDWSATALKTVQDHLFVVSSRKEGYSRVDASIVSVSDFNVESVEFGKDHSASEFFPVIPPGTTVIDAIVGKTVIQPGVVKTTKPAPPTTLNQTQVPAPPPIQAGQPQTESNMSFILGGLSAALLTAGAALWWKHRHGT